MKLTKVAVVIIVATIISIAGAAYAVYAWNGQVVVHARTATASAPLVTVSSDVDDLLPGKSKPLAVSVTNKNSFGINVTSFGGGSTLTKGGCPAYALKVIANVSTASPYFIPAHTTKALPARVEMESWADLRCAGQDFSIETNIASSPA